MKSGKLELNVCKHLMHDENGQYVGTLQFVPVEQAQKLFDVLKNVELLVRINHPMHDGCEMHKDIKAALELARWK